MYTSERVVGSEPDTGRKPPRAWRNGREPAFETLLPLRECMEGIDDAIADVVAEIPIDKLTRLVDLLGQRAEVAVEAAVYKATIEEVYAPERQATNIERAVGRVEELSPENIELHRAVRKLYSFLVPSCVALQVVAYPETEPIEG